MAEQQVEFRKIREFGENLNDTFLFIRQNFKPLLTSFFAICAIFLLGQAIFAGLYQSNAFKNLEGLRTDPRNLNWLSKIFSADYFLMLIFGWLAYTSMKLSLVAYIKLYVENNGAKPNIDDIWNIFRKYFIMVFFSSIPIFMLAVIGYMFCLAPGIYLTVVFIPFELVLIMENATFGQAWQRCFALIKDNFWISLAIYVVAGLIYWVSLLIITSVISLITGVSAFLTTHDINKSTAIITNVLNMFSSAFFVVFYISAALHYFNLVERLDGTGMLKRLDTIGKNNNNFDNTEEQY